MYSLTPSSSSSSSSSSPTTPTLSRASPPYDGGVGGGWGPYSSSKEFDINMASILIILVLATFLAFVLHAAIRFLLRLCHRRRRLLQSPTAPSPNSLQKRNKDSAPSIDDGLPTLIFSAGTKLAGGAEVAECAICLSEFVEGDGVRVLPACNHGFHVKCVEGWLASKSSCPTCRTSHRPAAAVGAAAEP